MAAPAKYIPEVHDRWAWSLAINGGTDRSIADAFDVSKRTIIRWKYVYDKDGKPQLDENGEKILSSFGRMLQIGKDAADAKVKHSLFENATGFFFTEEEKIIEYDTDGSVKPVKVRTVKKYKPPDTMAQIYWLNNRSRDTGEWSQKQDNAVSQSVQNIQNQIVTIADLINHPQPNREHVEEE